MPLRKQNKGLLNRVGCLVQATANKGLTVQQLHTNLNSKLVIYSQQHASFRDSKLTRILQNALGGNSKTAIISTITPAHVEESDSTLKVYGLTAKKIFFALAHFHKLKYSFR